MSEIEIYLEKRTAFIAANKAVDDLSERFLVIIRNLNERTRSNFWIHDVDFTLPSGAQVTRNSPSVKASDFPTPQQTADVLSKWHHARKEVMDTYRAIPDHYRSSVLALPPEAAASSSREKK